MNVLFIGNSYTFYNDLPGMLQHLARNAGKELTATHVTSGGKSLEWHWYNNETLHAIDKGGWDYVVLQDHSTQGVEHPGKLVDKVTDFSARIRAAGADPVLYNTWTRQHIPEKQDAINAAYARAAELNNCAVAPAGQAWTILRDTAPDVNLYVADLSHPSVPGSYATACVFYATLLNESPETLSSSWSTEPGVTLTLDEPVAKVLRKAAWDAVRKSGSDR